MIESARYDLADAVRRVSRHRVFAATAIVTLALGIGANTAIFSVVNGVILRPLPFGDPDRIVQVYETSPLTPEGSGIGGPFIDAFRNNSRSFEALSAYEASARYLRGADAPERVLTVGTERDLFAVLGVPPILGRTFRRDDPQSVVVIGETFWTDRLGRSPGVIGSTLTLDDELFTVIGVMPRTFQFPYAAASLLNGVASQGRTDLWMLFARPGEPIRGRPRVVGRLRANVSPAAAESELVLLQRRVQSETRDATSSGRGIRIVPLTDAVVGNAIRQPLYILLGAVGIVLLLACANVTNLALVRATLGRREVAVRAALGASSVRLVRQLLAESLVLSLTGGVLGLAIAKVGTDQMMLLARTRIPRAPEVTFDWTVFLFLFAVCLLTSAASGLAPALIARHADPRALLQDGGGRATMGAAARRLRDALVVVEVALAFILAVAGALLVRELARLHSTDPGLTADNVITFHVGHRRTPRTDARQFYEIADRAAGLPGVAAAGFTQLLPLQNWNWTSNSTDFVIEGRPPLAGPPFPIELRYVTPGYFKALGISIRRGRGLSSQDTPEAPRVILINDALARLLFGDNDPTGFKTTRGTIAGVVADTRQVHMDRPAAPEIYYPIAQNWSQVTDLGMTLVVRTENARPESLVDSVRSIVRTVNPDFAVFNVKTMETVVAESLSDFTLYLRLMMSFAVLALLLAASGTYGVMSFVATSRMREFAIRFAVGADRARVTWLILRQAVWLTAFGLAAGMAGAVLMTPLLRNLPVAIRPPDVMTTAPVALLIVIVSFVACLLPASRAASAEPMAVLRNE